ncbi:chitobiase/beta-hexosaminidase C-terminal domain-containing protein [Leptospira sp. 2 VSF19]|uniref:Chitobiase/beta-hexosaminidase C-terminal domain-containing protein n=1 Tax=Leptospira soteropolitanensis TaxID=2950025 RepID=A0AAW5VGE4_9LEPT|nr:chitobiase/beta-hexosaminidase C-terminal domain-containing protein [Leptospira soteropolitanensis]MCW7491101.1 chitobiase/beta-hexosaminidase C-terminal domain-containing protein [Leptospira soteropolitanensis]MCW7498685.1 chitobiase/beta-hexosaminidase C-terminal domain-containing protein [Leptospira soteropolitanensis]MCW7521722.1 chitobiase/beta-hexosaminidase C-terminal domain-containing protein [Leptospira soteropolitanensis]MCW7524789.1 chitobiase/beta-hexosaminidase C-terminal domain
MRIPKSIFLFIFFVLFTNRCLLFLPNGNNEQNFSPFAFLLGLLGGSPSSAQNLSPGATVDLSGDGKPDGTLVDSDGDGVSDGINLTGGTTPNLILIDTNGDGTPDAVDANGDGIPDYYISPNPPGFLTTGPGGTGNPVVIIVDGSGNPLGFDTDGDGTPNDTAIVTILGDTTPPTITSSLATGTFSTTQTTTLTCSDNKAPGSIVYTLDASAPSFSPVNGTVIAKSSQAVSLSTEGTHTLQALCRDLAGNFSTPINIVYTIDTKIPAVTLVSQSATAISASVGAISSSTATWKSDRSGSFTVREGSSCDSGTVATTGSVTANVDQTFIRSHTHFTGEGTKTYRICVTASNGLVGFVSLSLQRDDTAPTVTASPGAGSYGEATSVSLSCSDTGGSGCEQVAYAVQAGSAPSNPAIQGTTGTVSSGSLYTAAITMTDGAVTYTKFVARDKAGNVSNVSSQNYTVDTQVATITVNSHTAAINGSSNVSVSWQSSKAGAYHIRLGGSSCTTGTALSNTGSNANVTGNAAAATDITSTIANSHFAEGDNALRICVANLIGSFGSTTRTTNKDTTAPIVTMASPSGSGPFASGTQLQLSCSDTGGSGCDKIIYTLNGAEPAFDGSGSVTNGTVYSSPVALSNGSNQVKYLARDLAGNLSTAGNQSFHVGPPNAPAFVEAQAGGTSAVVQWWPVTGATSYEVYYSTSPGVTTAATSFGPVADPYATITGLNGGTLYYFRVVASNSFGSSTISLFESVAITTASAPGSSETGIYLDFAAAGQMYPEMVIDPINKKLLILATISVQANRTGGKLNFTRCDLNGLNCSMVNISDAVLLTQADGSGRKPSAVVDTINAKLLIATEHDRNQKKLSLFRCDLTGNNCIHKDVSTTTGQGIGSGLDPKAILDSINNKIIILTRKSGSSDLLNLFRCDLDGNNCEYKDISSVQNNSSGYIHNLEIDSFHKKLMILTTNGTNNNKPSLNICDLDGNNCNHTDISSSQGTNSGLNLNAKIDFKNKKLLVVATNGANSSKPSLYRCNLDGSNCNHNDLSVGQGAGSGSYPNLKIDIVNQKLLVVTHNSSNSGKLSLFQCELDGNNCSHKNISPDPEYSSMANPVSIINPISGKLMVLSVKGFGAGNPKLVIW